jgi:glycosyltransferase involved in cell wall biosynthesis
MRIGIDAGPIVGGAGGVGTHTTELLAAMLDHDKATEFFAYIPSGTSERLARKGSWTNASNLHWVEAGRWTMSWEVRRNGIDLFHGPNFKMWAQGRCGGIVTIHDVWLDRAPEYSTKIFGQRWSFGRTKRTVWRAKRVVTVSHFSAQEIADLYGLPAARIAVIPNGVSRSFWPERNEEALSDLRRRMGFSSKGCLLFVGGADPRKNHRQFLAASARCRDAWTGSSLVLVGDPIHRFGNYLESAKEYGLEKDIVCVGRVSPDVLRLLYSYARLFVFPSRYEGFGMPVLEAMACGAPTITSTASALPEVAGGAALLTDPDNPEQLAEAMTRVLTDETLREDLRARGFALAKEMTWHAAAVQTLNLYRDLCVGGRQ